VRLYRIVQPRSRAADSPDETIHAGYPRPDTPGRGCDLRLEVDAGDLRKRVHDLTHGDAGAAAEVVDGVQGCATSTLGVPYTAELEEKTSAPTPSFSMASSRLAVNTTFSW
jgi:hypothetical protein